MPFQSMAKDKVTLVKKDGTLMKEDMPAVVSAGQITTFVTEFPIEVDDHLLRQLPNGLVEDYIVSDPQYYGGLSGIPANYQIKVRRSSARAAPPQTIIANFHGANSRMNVNSTDSSVNIASGISGPQLTEFISQVRSNMSGLSGDHQSAIMKSLADLEEEAGSASPSPSKIHGALQAIKSVTEGAAGNLIAAGIGALIGKLLGGV
jgi:hypothetical protein